MLLKTLEVKGNVPFKAYLLDNVKVKRILKDFDFYNVYFYREECSPTLIVYLNYPKGNLYWYLDFEKAIENYLESNPEYQEEWRNLLSRLKSDIKDDFQFLKAQLERISASEVVDKEIQYQLRDYQAYDLLQFLIKYKTLNNKGLILSDPRTGKSRVALAACAETATLGDVIVIICPKSAEVGWMTEIEELNKTNDLFDSKVIVSVSSIKSLSLNPNKYNVRVISYDLFKKYTVTQLRQLTSSCKHITLVCDEVHRLRNFKTQQSKAIFDFKNFCVKEKASLGIIGLTGTISVKGTEDVFGPLSLINDSKIRFRPTYECLDTFKEYFYFCVDTSFGKKAQALRREHELNYVLQNVSVQTKRKDLDLFKNYKKEYRKVELEMDPEQYKIYTSVYETMEYDEDIDCQNKLVQLVRLQQICIDPSVLIAKYEHISPKLKWVIAFAKANNFKFIVACKKAKTLRHLMTLLYSNKIEYASILGSYNYTERLAQIKRFGDNKDVKVMVLQFDTGKESLTLPMAKAIVFLDRDFAQGFNDQAEARMTPVHGEACTKYVIDLVMKSSKEEEIYNTLVIKKKSIDAMNLVFKPKERKL